MLVHAVGACEQFLEVADADRHGDRQADGRPQRIAAADPVPHRQDVLLADAERHRRLGVARYRHEMPVQLALAAALG
jgi:hypothetical protein